jgi:hypothetical protein
LSDIIEMSPFEKRLAHTYSSAIITSSQMKWG